MEVKLPVWHNRYSTQNLTMSAYYPHGVGAVGYPPYFTWTKPSVHLLQRQHIPTPSCPLLHNLLRLLQFREGGREDI